MWSPRHALRGACREGSSSRAARRTDGSARGPGHPGAGGRAGRGAHRRVRRLAQLRRHRPLPRRRRQRHGPGARSRSAWTCAGSSTPPATGAEEWIGRRVVAMTNQSFGGMAERALPTTTSVFDAPPELDDVEAAAFTAPVPHRLPRAPPPGTPAGRRDAARRRRGQRGRHGGDPARGGGRRPRDRGRRRAREGRACARSSARTAIDHTTDDLFDRVMEHTDGRGAEVVVDLVGGDGTETIWTCMAREGRYLPVGFNDDPESGLTGRPLRKVVDGQLLGARRDARLHRDAGRLPAVRHQPVPTRGRPGGARRAARARRRPGRSARSSAGASPWTRSRRRSRTTSSAAPSGRTVVDLARG